jgi:hypothetical protein
MREPRTVKRLELRRRRPFVAPHADMSLSGGGFV